MILDIFPHLACRQQPCRACFLFLWMALVGAKMVVIIQSNGARKWKITSRMDDPALLVRGSLVSEVSEFRHRSAGNCSLLVIGRAHHDLITLTHGMSCSNPAAQPITSGILLGAYTALGAISENVPSHGCHEGSPITKKYLRGSL